MGYFCIYLMFFAGFTSVVAKMGLSGISAELGLTIRTLFVAAFVIMFAITVVPKEQIADINSTNLFWLGLSGVTTAVSWIFYYKAIKEGDVATVALIDKGSVVIAMLMAWLLLKEVITLRMLMGAAMIVAGLFIIAKK